MDIKQFEKVEIFLQKKWIPLFIENFTKRNDIADYFGTGLNRKKLKETITDMLIEFNKKISIKRLEMHKDYDKKRIMGINN